MSATHPLVASCLAPYENPPAIYLANEGSQQIPTERLVAAAIVICSGRVLLLQRAPHAFQALLWEIPGGKCDAADKSVLASAVRELREETGLEATKVIDVVGKHHWLDHGELWKKVLFLVDVEPGDGAEFPAVQIAPREQKTFVWASEAEVMENKCGSLDLKWTSEETRQMVLNAFKLLQSI